MEALGNSLKRTDLEKNKGLKINARMHAAPTPGRFAKEAGAVPDRREQRRLDQAAGLVPFAVKLDSALVDELRAASQSRQIGISELVGELLRKALRG